MKMGHQLRIMAGGLGTPMIIGFDMTSAFALAGGLGISPAAVATFLPLIEAAAVPAMNARNKPPDG